MDVPLLGRSPNRHEAVELHEAWDAVKHMAYHRFHLVFHVMLLSATPTGFGMQMRALQLKHHSAGVPFWHLKVNVII